MNELDRIFKFCDFDYFYDQYQPFTAYGKRVKNQKTVYYALKPLSRQYELLQLALDLIRSDPYLSDKISYHLKKIPPIQADDLDCCQVTDLFLIKKFLYHYKELSLLLPGALKKKCHFIFESDSLLQYLSTGQKQADYFCISNQYSPELKNIRLQIQALNEKISRLKTEQLEHLKKDYQLDFQNMDFLIIDKRQALAIPSTDLYQESYDSRHLLVKPVYSQTYLARVSEQEQLVKQEKKLENSVIETIQKKISREKNHLLQYMAGLENLDTSLAKARLAFQYQLVCPDICDADEPMEIINGIYLPLKEKCKQMQLKYWPLSIQFQNKINVIHGSNMGGKTIVLKSLAFWQLLTQMGFYIPAEKFKTGLFNQFCIIGETSQQTAGLSRFGMQIYQLNTALDLTDQPSLFLCDEFASSTNTREATALLYGLLTYFKTKNTITAYLSTHFMDIARLKKVDFYKMKGLDEESYLKYWQNNDRQKDKLPLIERIRMINQFMSYQLIPETQSESIRDALKIARILGLDHKIIDAAGDLLNEPQ